MIHFTVVRDDIREQLRVSLYAQRVSITNLAKELGMSRTNLSRMLNGQLEGKFDVWERIAAKVGKRFTLEDAPKDGGR
jgi:AraC-like DNA-binding protein